MVHVSFCFFAPETSGQSSSSCFRLFGLDKLVEPLAWKMDIEVVCRYTLGLVICMWVLVRAMWDYRRELLSRLRFLVTGRGLMRLRMGQWIEWRSGMGVEMGKLSGRRLRRGDERG